MSVLSTFTGATARVPGPVWLVVVIVAAALIGLFTDVVGLVTGLGLLNVVVVVALLLKRDITWGFLFYLTAVIFFQTGFWFRLPGFPDLYPSRVASTLLYLVFVAQLLMSVRAAPRIGAIEKSMMAFLAVLVISIVTSGQQPRWLILLSGYFYPFLFYYFARTVMTREEQLRIVFAYLVVLGIYLGVMGILEKAKLYELVFPRFIVDPSRGEGLAKLGYRVRGIFLQPAVLGSVMTMAFFTSHLYLSSLRNIFARVAQVLLVLVSVPTIYFTQTRSVYAGFLCALMIAAVFSRQLRRMSLLLILAGMVGVFLNWDNLGTEDRDVGGIGNLDTVEARIELAFEAAEIFLASPLVGCGYDNFQEVAPLYRRPRDIPFYGHIDQGTEGGYVLHNMVATVAAEQGLLGLVPYLLIYFLILRVSIRAYRDLPKEGLISRDFVVCVWCAMACYFVNAMFLEYRYFEYPNVLYFFLMGCMVGIYERFVARRRREEAGAAPGTKMVALPVSGEIR
ncbi:MAG TPA: O-antigen ligase family protein [bacterium]|nr:O-antigen ligase family protein [bacterium]